MLEGRRIPQFVLQRECFVREVCVMFGLEDGSTVEVPVLLLVLVCSVGELLGRTCVFLYFHLCLLTAWYVIILSE